MKHIIKTYDLVLIGLLFIGFFFSITSASIDFYFHNRFFEGFQVVGGTVIFTLLMIPLLVLLLIRKKYENLIIFGLLVFIIFALGFLGFKLPLTVLPIISGYGMFYTGKQFIKRIKNLRNGFK